MRKFTRPIFLIMIFLGSCRTDQDLNSSKQNFGDEKGGITIVGNATPLAEEGQKKSGGILVRLQNHLAQHKPDLSMQMCNEDQAGKHRWCIGIKKNVPFSLKKDYLFFIDDSLLKLVLDHSPNKTVTFRFNDTYTRSLVHWHCYEHLSTEANRGSIEVEVTQINVASYSCNIQTGS